MRWGPSGDGLSGLDRAFRQPQTLMVAPGVLAGWTVGASFRGDGIPIRDDGARDAPFAGATSLTAAHVNGREAHVGTIIVHRALFVAARGVTLSSQYEILVQITQHVWTIEEPCCAAAMRTKAPALAC
jgi:hypothetical protein